MLQIFFQIAVTILKNQIEFFISRNDLFKVDYIGMLEYLEKGNFPNGSGWYAFVLMIEPDLFHGYNLVGLFIASFVDDSVGSLTDFIDLLVAIALVRKS